VTITVDSAVSNPVDVFLKSVRLYWKQLLNLLLICWLCA